MDRVELLKFLREKFSDHELRDLCFELAIDYESLGGEGKVAKARELVAFCERRDRLIELEQNAQHLLAVSKLGAARDSFGVSDSKQISVLGNYVDQSTHGDVYNIHIDHADNLAIGQGASVSVSSVNNPSDSPSVERASLQYQLDQAQEKLHLIEERISEYVMSTAVDLQLIKQQRHWKERVAELEQQLAART